MEVDLVVYYWLTERAGIADDNSHQINAEGNKITLSHEVTSKLESGLLFAPLVSNVNRRMVPFDGNLKTDSPASLKFDEASFKNLKDSSTPASKLYNWNIINKALEAVGVKLEKEAKSLAVSGDHGILADILGRLHAVDLNLDIAKINKDASGESDIQDLSSPSGYSPNSQGSPLAGRRGKAPVQKALAKHKEGVDITALDPTKEISDIDNCLEFLLATICKTMQLKPKQAAGLLTNGNKYLNHVVIKGMKGEYEPVIAWYQEVYAHSKHLTNLIQNEEGTSALLMVLNILKTGLLSKNYDVAVWCCRLLSKMAYDFANNDLIGPAWDWFINLNDGGIDPCLQCIKKHFEAVDSVASVFVQFGRYNFLELFSHHLKNLIKDNVEYISLMHDFYGPIAEMKLSKDELLTSGLLDHLIEISIRMADGGHTIEERVAAISFLGEIWTTHSHKVEEKEEIASNIHTMLKRGCRDKSKILRFCALGQLFRLLETFSAERNPYAPIIYKTLTFSLVENHQDIALRDYMMSAFKNIFEHSPSIPVGIVLEPLIKQIQVSENITYVYNIFDFDFFVSLAKHPKLNIKNGIQIIDFLAKVYLNDAAFALPASVPFMLVISRFLEAEPMQEFLIKFAKAKIAASMLLQFEKRKKQQQQQQKGGVRLTYKGAQLALPSHPGEGRQNLSDEEVSKILKKSLIIEILKKIINLKNEYVNEEFKPLLLNTNMRVRQLYERDHKGIMSLLSWWGEPNTLMNNFESEHLAKMKVDKEEGMVKEDQDLNMDTKSVDFNKDSQRALVLRENKDDGLSYKSDHTVDRSVISEKPGLKDTKRLYQDSYSLVPYAGKKKANTIESKAMREIEKIRRKKEEKLEMQKLEQERKQLKSQRKRKALKQQLEKRKIQFGVATKNQHDEEKQIVFDEGAIEKNKKKEKKILPEISFFDIDKEEERDRETLSQYLRKYSKVFKFLFSKYSNTGYSVKNVNSFDALQNKAATINIAEITKMLKDHNLAFQRINKEELATLIRLVNVKSINKSDLTALTYDGFLNFLVQLGMLVFSRPPKDISHLPPVESVKALVEHFEQATRSRGESTLLYDDPDITTIGDQDVLKELNKRIAEDPYYPIPEGYYKVSEKEIVQQYKIPEYFEMKKKKKIVLEVLDKMLADAFGFHFLEPITTYEIKNKVKPAIKKQTKPVAQFNYMAPVQKKLRPINTAELDNMKKNSRRNLLEPIKISISTSLKMEVAKEPLAKRPLVQEVAEVLEEMLQAVEAGRERLVDRQKMGLGHIMNKAKEEKINKEQEEQKLKEERDKKIVQRRQQINNDMAKLKEQKDKERTEKEAKEREAKLKEQKKKEAAEAVRKKDLEARKKEIEEKKLKQAEEAKKKEELEEKKKSEEKAKKEAEQKEFFAKQSKKIKEDLGAKSKQREEAKKAELDKEEENKKKEALKKKKLEEFLAKEREKNEGKKQMKEELREFAHSAEVQKLYETYDKQLRCLFDFYAKLKDIQMSQKANSITFNSFVKFGYGFNITPSLIPIEEFIYIFKSAVKESSKEKNTDNATLDFDLFKEVLIKIGAYSKEQLGGLDEDKVRSDNTVKVAMRRNTTLHEKGEKKKEEIKEKKKEENKSPQGKPQTITVPEFEEKAVYRDFDTSGMTASTIEALFTLLKMTPGDNKTVLEKKLNALRDENLKVIPSTLKKKSMLAEGKIGDALKNMTQNLKEEGEKLAAVNDDELEEGGGYEDEIISPDGKKENWKVEEEKGNKQKKP